MGVISGSNTTIFKSSKFIFSKVRRFLKSFDAANMIDEGEFPTYVKDVLKLLPGAYMESQALCEVKNFRAKLPDNFGYLYVAYKCGNMDTDLKGKKKHQQNAFAFVTEVDDAYIIQDSNCEIKCCEQNNKVVERITVQQYVIEEKVSFNRITPLRLSPNVGASNLIDGCENMLNNSIYEISINEGYIYTNFDEDYIYLKYYGFPIDEDGDILIPDIEPVEKAIEWYIIYQILLSYWYNSSVPDIQNKWQDAEMKYNKFFAAAKYHLKLPSFAEMVNTIRVKRSQSPLVYMTQQYSNTNFQRSR